jgi:hypothetical protein
VCEHDKLFPVKRFTWVLFLFGLVTVVSAARGFVIRNQLVEKSKIEALVGYEKNFIETSNATFFVIIFFVGLFMCAWSVHLFKQNHKPK